MVAQRRKSDKHTIGCQPHNPICMTIGFMFGTIVGSIIHTEHSLLSVILSVTAATAVFHLTFVRNVNFVGLLSKVIKKGS